MNQIQRVSYCLFSKKDLINMADTVLKNKKSLFISRLKFLVLQDNKLSQDQLDCLVSDYLKYAYDKKLR